MMNTVNTLFSRLSFFGAIAGLSACSFSFSIGGLSMSKVESEIEGWIVETTQLSVDSVTCPEGSREFEEGDMFECSAALEGDATIFFSVSQTSDDGDVEWVVDRTQSVLDLSKIETFVSQQINQPIALVCNNDPSLQFLVAHAGDVLECDVSDDQGNQEVLVINVEDDAGNVNLNFASE
jgi:hypothetical protein